MIMLLSFDFAQRCAIAAIAIFIAMGGFFLGCRMASQFRDQKMNEALNESRKKLELANKRVEAYCLEIKSLNNAIKNLEFDNSKKYKKIKQLEREASIVEDAWDWK